MKHKLSLSLDPTYCQINLHIGKVLIPPRLSSRANTCGLNDLTLEKQIVLGFLPLISLRLSTQ